MNTWRLAKALAVLRAEVDALYPGRDRRQDGTIGDVAHSARTSDHNPDGSGVVRALDVDDDDERPGDVGIGWAIAESLRKRRDRRVKYVIYHGRMFSSYATSGTPAWTWRSYSGPNPHETHLHVSVVPDSRADDTSPWRIGEDIMTPAQEQKVDRLLASATRVEAELRRLRGVVEATQVAVERVGATAGPAIADHVWQRPFPQDEDGRVAPRGNRAERYLAAVHELTGEATSRIDQVLAQLVALDDGEPEPST